MLVQVLNIMTITFSLDPCFLAFYTTSPSNPIYHSPSQRMVLLLVYLRIFRSIFAKEEKATPMVDI